jgi:acetyl-CoA carboxylase beta subunit
MGAEKELSEMNKDKKHDSKKNRVTLIIGKCPSCNKPSYQRWVLDKNYGLCMHCGKKWPLKKSTQVPE